MSIEEVIVKLTDDPRFVQEIKAGIYDILKDGRIDAADIPQFVIVLSIALEKVDKLQIKQENVPEAIVVLTKTIVNKFNLVPEDKMEVFNKSLDASLKLLFFQPNIKGNLNTCCPGFWSRK